MSAASAPSDSPSNPSIKAPPIVAIGGEIGHGKDTVAQMIAEIASKEGITFEWSKFATDLRTAMAIITDIPAEETTSDEDKAKPIDHNMVRDRRDIKQRIRKAVEFATEKDPSGTTTVRRIFGVIADDLEDTDDAVAAGISEPAAFKEMTVGRFLQVLGTDAFRDHVDKNVWVNSYHRRRARGGNKPTLTPDARFPNEVESVKTTGGVTVHVVRPGYEGKKDGRDKAHASENKDDSFIKTFDIHILNNGSLDELRWGVQQAWPLIKKIAAQRAGVAAPAPKA